MEQPPSDILCSDCGTQTARNFVTSIINGVSTQLNLCDACFETNSVSAGMDLPQLDGAACDYCGSPATGAGMNSPWELAASGKKFHYHCLPCLILQAEEIHRYMAESKPDFEEMDQKGMMAFIQEIDARVRRRSGLDT